MDKLYGQHEIIINLSLCGDWAGATFDSVSACQLTGSSCEAYVARELLRASSPAADVRQS